MRSVRLLAVSLIASAVLVAGCGSKTDQASTAPPTTDASTAAPEGALPPIVPAPAVTQASWAPDALEELLAPIALYPDQLLGQVLAASVNSQEVLDGGNWLLQNEKLTGDELDKATETAGFGPAMRALVHFPTVVDMMCQQIDWTRQVGSAFSSDQKSVLDAVQRLRAQAAEVGNLKSTPEQTVETKTDNNKVVVEVKPADPKVVYVPTYDPQGVYTTPPPATTTTTTDTVSTGTAVAAGLFAFGVGILIGNAMHDDYCYPHWGYGAVYIGPRPFYPPAYVYRPVYGPAFRPAYGYASPPGYRYSYNNVDINVDRNVVINNNNYYNRFDNNKNLHGGTTKSPLATTQHAGTQSRVGQTSAANRADSWKGQSTYAGARNPATADRVNQAAGNRPGASQSGTQARTGDRQLGGSAGTRDTSLSANRAQSRAQPAHVDRGYGASTRTASHEPPAFDRAQQPSTNTLGGATRSSSTHGGDSAFAGASQQGSGSFDRASSARGHASAGSQQRAAHSGGRRR